jgi:hypothetical protein
MTSIVDRTSLSVRDEITLSSRTCVFGQFSYLRDAFKEIDYLMSLLEADLTVRLYETLSRGDCDTPQFSTGVSEI